MTKIIVALITAVKGIIGFLLPESIFAADIFSNFALYFDFFVDFLIKVNFLIPLPTIFTCLNIMLTIKMIKFGIFMYNWFIRAVLDVIP